MGEYARSLALATAVSERWPGFQIHFALSREAPYIAENPFPKTLLPKSPTYHTPEMTEVIRSFHPTLVILDNAGRGALVREARESGARVIYVSSRPLQRLKAFRLGWMRNLDEHWIAWPEFIAGSLSLLERLKHRVVGGPVLRFIDTVLPSPDPDLAARVMAEAGVSSSNYILMIAGGGTGHAGAEDAPQIVAEASRRIAERGFPIVQVGGVPPPAAGPALRHTPRLPMTHVAQLIRGARAVVCNGGDTLLQVLSCGRPCVTFPIAHDQPRRIAQCRREGLILSTPLEAKEIAATTLQLLDDAELCRVLTDRLREFRITNGMEIALESIQRLAALPRRRRGPTASVPGV